MNIRFLCCLSASIALVAPATLAAADAKPAPAPATPAASAKPAKPALEKGMTAEEVIKAIGKPAEIKPMATPEGTTVKAEMWIYRRDGGTRVVQVPVGTREVPGYVGSGQAESSQHITEIIYGMKTIKMTQVTSLLMYDGKLALARQSQETSERY